MEIYLFDRSANVVGKSTISKCIVRAFLEYGDASSVVQTSQSMDHEYVHHIPCSSTTTSSNSANNYHIPSLGEIAIWLFRWIGTYENIRLIRDERNIRSLKGKSWEKEGILLEMKRP